MNALPLIELLLERGANPLIKDRYGRNSFEYLALEKNEKSAEDLLKIMLLLTKPLKYDDQLLKK